MYVSTFSKHWDPKHGYTYAEALHKKELVDEGHGVNGPNPKWAPAQIEPDPEREDGYRVVIRSL